MLYGSSTIFAYTSGDGVHFFTLDPSLGDYLLTSENVQTHGSSHVYSANEGNSGKWNAPDLNWVEHVKSEGYSGRYIGALVADFHRNLMKGGIYAYPGDKAAQAANSASCLSARRSRSSPSKQEVRPATALHPSATSNRNSYTIERRCTSATLTKSRY